MQHSTTRINLATIQPSSDPRNTKYSLDRIAAASYLPNHKFCDWASTNLEFHIKMEWCDFIESRIEVIQFSFQSFLDISVLPML